MTDLGLIGRGAARIRCPRSGCGGAVGTDGFCDTCWVAAVPERPVGGTGARRCRQPGCAGTVGTDGFCDTCWVQNVEERPEHVVWAEVPWEADPGGPARRPLDLPADDGRALARAEVGLGLVTVAPPPPRDDARLLIGGSSLDAARGVCPDPACRSRSRRDGGAVGAVGGLGGLDGVGGVGGAGGGVGGGRAGDEGPDSDVCPECGTPYPPRPRLAPGTSLGQYDVQGCIGYGGQGWVYLAHDRNLNNDRVAIKGLRDTRAPGARAVTAAEHRNLIDLRHPDIVDIRNFVVHDDPAAMSGTTSGTMSGTTSGTTTGAGTRDEYIVLEFLDGESLEEKRRAAPGGVMPVAEAIACVLAVMPALAYLHESRHAYVDFKPANVMQVGRRVKLVDLGAVQYIGPDGRTPALNSVVTAGYTAPEVDLGGTASVGSDLFAVGRTLAVLTADFDHQGRYRTALPGPHEVEVFGRYESFYRFLVRATEPDPTHRFTGAAQFAEQLAAVLREVVALDAAPGAPGAVAGAAVSVAGPAQRSAAAAAGPRRTRPPSVPSALFTAEQGLLAADPLVTPDPAAAALALPRPHPAAGDPVVAFLAGATAADVGPPLDRLREEPGGATAVALYRATACIGRGDYAEARSTLAEAVHGDPADWRFVWYRGLIDLADRRPENAWKAFARIRDVLPGELAPKLALAVTAESLHRVKEAQAEARNADAQASPDNKEIRAEAERLRLLADQARALAEHYFTAVWLADDSYVAAVFGVARLDAAKPGADQVARAVGVLESIPRTLRHHRPAGIEALRLRLARPGLDGSALRDAADRLTGLGLGPEEHLRLRVLLWEAAAAWLRGGGKQAGTAEVLGVALTPEAIGTALEADYLGLRRYVTTRRARAELARRAHAARPRTRW